jgi:AcrR family transcriptional regulator
MKAPREDRRIQKTKNLLREALVSLILEKDYDSIIIQDILDRANVGRSTFYLHYEDKDRLLMAGFSDLREHLNGVLKASPPIRDNPSEHLLRFSLFMFEHAYGHIALYRALAPKRGTLILQSLHDVLAGFISEQARPLFRKAGGGIPFELFVHFLASSFISAMSWWVGQKDPIPPKDINVIFRALVMPSVMSRLG